jgi:Caspase domain
MNHAAIWKTIRVLLVSWFVAALCASGCSNQDESVSGDGADLNYEDTGSTIDPEAAIPELASATEEPGPPALATMEPYAGNSHALLVGCTTYDHLPEENALRGPANDVSLMRDVLMDRFGFDEERIRTLTEDSKAHGRPIKAMIAKELERLAEIVEEGDRVVILLSGHGSQQPDNDPGNPDDPEPDGLDEIFCPADIDFAADEDRPFVANALTDDELREAIDRIRAKGGFAWVIVDSCHSGSAVRGTETYRQLAPEYLVGRKAILDAKRATKAGVRGISDDDSAMDCATDKGGLVAIYAAQPDEPTLEMMLPDDADDAEWRGLLTYTLVKVLTSAERALSYRELVQRIHSEYVQSYGRLGPTPLIEGTDQHRQVLEQTELPVRSSLVLTATKDGAYRIRAGRLHGFSKGTIFAVFAPPGEVESTTPFGHVIVTRAELVSATVRPSAFDGIPRNTQLPAGGRVEPVEIHYGALSLKVALDNQADDDTGSELTDVLQELENDPNRRIEFVSGLQHADWIVRCTEVGACFLVPCEGWSKIPDDTHFGPAPAADRLGWFRDRLSRIARVKTLLKLCAASEKQPGGHWLASLLGAKEPCAVNLDLLEYSSESDEWQPIDWPQRDWKLSDGEQVLLRIRNVGSETIDFSVLFIDSRFGITPLFPSSGVVADNRIRPDQTYSVGPMQVEASTVGLEHLFVIATRVDGQPQEFGWLAQESLEAAQRASRSGLRGRSNSAFGELLQEALYSNQNVRGMRMSDTKATSLRAISWQTAPVEKVQEGSAESR